MTNSSKTEENEGGRVSKRQSVSKRERERNNKHHTSRLWDKRTSVASTGTWNGPRMRMQMRMWMWKIILVAVANICASMERLSRLSLVTCMHNSQLPAGYLLPPSPLLPARCLLLLFTAAVDVCGDIWSGAHGERRQPNKCCQHYLSMQWAARLPGGLLLVCSRAATVLLQHGGNPILLIVAWLRHLNGFCKCIIM